MENLAKIIVDEAICEINLDQDASGLLKTSPETLLLNSESTMDSLALVRLLISAERLIEEKTGRAVTLVDESSFEAEESPFATVGTLTAHISKLLKVC